MSVIELKPSTIAMLDLGPDDIVIVRSSVNLTRDQTDQIGKTVKKAVGDHKVLVLTPNLSIEVLKQ